jgi:signal peptidase
MKRILTICSVALLALAGGVVLLFNSSSTLGWQALDVPTGSMQPAISPGSMVFVHRVPAPSLKVGDVITYANPLHPQQTISHRIIKKSSSGGVPIFVTKGDANPSADIPISSGSIKGKVVWHVPHLGAAVMWSRTPIGMLPFIYIPALLIMIEEVQRLAAYWRAQRPYRTWDYHPADTSSHRMRRPVSIGTAGVAVMLVTGVFAWQPVLALLQSNPVSLAGNHLSAASSPVSPTCSSSTTNSTNINVTNTSSQSASTGSATSSGNTNGGTATSGDASNSNSTNVNINVNNGSASC